MECIYCKELLSCDELTLNMDFHKKCAPNIIEEAWRLLNEVPK